MFNRHKNLSKLRFTERLFNRFVLKYYSRNLLVDLQLHAKKSSVAYILEHMPAAMMTRDRWALLAFALSRAPDTGSILEFGVEKGDSLRFLAARTPRVVHGFDSFHGLPEDWTGTFEIRGKFTRHGALPKVPENVRLHVGWFDTTLPAYLATGDEPVALLHVDCDIYSSARTVLHGLAPRIVEGTVIVFDEYFNYPNWQQHEYRAFQEAVSAFGWAYEYLGFAAKNGHVAVRINAIKR